MQALLILFGAVFTVVTCYACGRLLLREAVTDVPICFVCGAAILSFTVFLIAAAGLVYPPVFLAMGAAAVWLARAHLIVPRPKTIPWTLLLRALAVLFLVYFVIYFVHAMAPEVSPDGASYHLALVARYLREHGFHRITTNIYASLSQGIEMLFLFAFAFGKHSAAALVHFAFLIALVWQMFAYGRNAGFPVVGASAAFLVFASPVVGIDGSSAYNDVAVAAIAFTLFQLLRRWDSSRNKTVLVAIGLLAGFAYAAKYTAAVAVPYAIGYVGWKSRRLKDVTVVAGFGLLLIVPWVAKNWLWVHNPTSPFFNQLFRNPYVTASFENEYRDYLAHYELSSLRQIPMQVTTYGGLQGTLGPIFLLLPLALLAALRREGRSLLLAALVFGLPYFSNIGTRFLIPSLPFLALALGLVLGRFAPLLIGIVALHAVLCWPSIVPKYARQNPWRFRGVPWKEALRIRPEEPYLERWIPDYGAVRLIEEVTPPGATVFSTDPIPEAYTSRRILVEYYSAENQVTGRILRTGAVPDYAPTLRLRFPFERQPLQALRVVQTAAGSMNLWTIHEFRVFDGARELPRRPEWRLISRPYPWGIQKAFDNSLVTFWISGDPLRPGMYVQLNFGEMQQADSVEIDTAPNQWQVRLQLEGLAPGGNWKLLTAAPQQSEEAAPLGLRRAVAEELKRHGIDYILVFDHDSYFADLHRNEARWGIREMGHSKTARLFQLP
ncbi:MAG: glycosyltransferase family 39 protein [Acidobacteriia bacterium]|nr:glycosyltransferase family 39 protein [Terriglobia bacterium]